MNTFRKNILVIEDEPDIAELIEFNLENNKYRTSIAYNGETGLEQARKNNPDLILLDLMLPGIHGLDVCRILKADNQLKNPSVIILSALGQEDNIVKGLEAGADDYITKPFSLKVLLARIKAVLRRDKETENNQSKTLLIHDILIMPKEREVKVGENKIDLTFTEFQILHLLASHPGWVFTRYQIIEKIRGDNYPVTDRSIDFQIVVLRKKFGSRGDFIQTIRSVVYRFKSDD